MNEGRKTGKEGRPIAGEKGPEAAERATGKGATGARTRSAGRGQGSWVLGADREDLMAILDKLPCGVAVLESPFGRVHYVNRQILDTLGYSLRDAPTTAAMAKKVIPEQGMREFSRKVWKKIARAGGGTEVFDALCGDGVTRTFEVRTVVLREDLIVALWMDVTQHRLLETELRESEPRFSSLFERSNDPFLLLDENRLVNCNLAAQELFGEWDRQRLLARTIDELSPDKQRDGSRSAISIQALLKTVLKQGSLMSEWTIRRSDGSEIPVEFSIAVVTTHEKRLFFIIARDVTRWKKAQTALIYAKRDLEARVKERTAAFSAANRQLRKEITKRKETEQESRRSREQLRLLSEHLQQIRDDDSRRIAREVHDRLGQSIAALKIDLAEVKEEFGDGRPGLREKVQEIERQVNGAMQSVREICKDLRPPVFDDLGLVSAVRWHLREFEKKTGISCTVVTDGAAPYPEADSGLVVFRIFQEAMSNILRHAGATAVRVVLRCDENRIVLRIRDNGRGISPEDISDPLSFGILGMRERVRFWGGSFTIQGQSGKGTALRVSIPLGRPGTPPGRMKRSTSDPSVFPGRDRVS